MTAPTADQLLNDSGSAGGGTPWLKWPSVGDERGGKVIADPETRQAIDFNTKEPEIWSKSLKPRYELIIKVQTDERDPEIEDDNGVRAFHLKEGSLALKAAREAVQEAGSKAIKIGDELFLKRGKNDDRAYTYTGRYTAGNASEAFLAPATDTVTTSSGQVLDAAKIKELKALGMDDAQIAAL